MIAKALGKMLISKKPFRSQQFRDRVKCQPCIACRGPGHITAPPSHAHHCRSIGPQGHGMLGRRVSDYLCVPLCDFHHDRHIGSLHKSGDERGWWKSIGVNPADWIAGFSEGGRLEVNRLEALS